jgi:flagellin-like hook-associated protein FlgL
MAIVPLGITNVSSILQSSLLAQSIDGTQAQLLQVQNELSTGQAVNQPSDNPSAAAMILQLNQTAARQTSYSTSINSASSQLAETDSSLGNLTTLLQQAEQIASADVGSDVTAAQRQSDVSVVQSLYNQAMAIGNQQYNGQYLFGGATGNTQPFIEVDGNVQYVGSDQTLQNQFDQGITTAFQISGADVFGSLASGVNGTANLAPQLTASTLLSDLGGAGGSGVRLGAIQISNGIVSKTVDLSSANTVGDVVNLINAAGVGGITAAISGQGLQITGAPTDNITITDVGGGTTAGDLGIATSSGGAGAGNPVDGSALQPQVTLLTPLSDLRDGSGIDNSGLTITNGTTTKTVTWSPTGTVQDMLNAINGAGLGVDAQINSAGTGINILNATQGASLSVGENGGTTAAELGLQTMAPSTPLSQLNNGQGVQTAGGATPDFQITDSAGATFQVALGSAQTVQDVLNAINTATGGAVTASVATTGSGIVLTDSSGGGGTLSVTPLNNSNAAAQLGLTAPAVGSTITGTDTGAVASAGIFGNLQALMAALQSGNQAAITAAGQGISTDTSRVIELHGQTGAIEQELQNRQTQLTQEQTATQSLVSQLQNANYADTVTKYQTLQTALEAGLQTGAASLSLSLLDFLE